VRENVLVNGDDIEMIDFDDGGHGWRMFDIATALFRNRDEPHYDAIRLSSRVIGLSGLCLIVLWRLCRSSWFCAASPISAGSGNEPRCRTRQTGFDVADALNLAAVLSSGAAG
jgi:hypothetical protein